MGPRTLAEERSRALHLAIAERLQADPALIDEARARVRAWLRDGTVARVYAEARQALLDRPLEDLVAALGERSERMHDLRQVSPFADALDARTRWRIQEAVRARR